MTAKDFMIGMLVGGVVGAGTALLFAPMEGAETRRKIADGTHAAKNKVSHAASRVMKREKEEAEMVKQAM